MRTRTKGIQLVNGERIVNKQHRGQRIFSRLGQASQEEAEAWLRARQIEVDAEHDNRLRSGAEQLFAAAAAKYLTECKQRGVKTLETISYHVTLLLPYVGTTVLGEVCNDSFETFKADRIEEGVTPTTVNRTLEVARTVLNRSARVWRANGKPWLSSAPLIEMLDEQRRPPRPITWAEQARLLLSLAPHLQRMVLFALNTGARDDNVCRLRWEWEVRVPELGRSVFVVPPEHYKAGRHHVLVLNDVAWRIVEECRGMHPENVFVWRRERVTHLHKRPVMEYAPVGTINNTGFQTARRTAGLESVRVHDLRHTFGQRLRAAGVADEDRALLLGHATEGMPQHYATATVARLVELANTVNDTRDRATLSSVVGEVAQNVAHKEQRASCVNS